MQGIFFKRKEMTAAQQLQQELQNLADEKKAKHLSQFFKTGKGQYAEGDIFLGINVPVIKSIVKKYYKNISRDEITDMLHSPWHDYRFAALQILVRQYEQATENEQKALVDVYLTNLVRINNWDLVDCSAHKIIGAWAYQNKDLNQIEKLADSKSLWQERIAVVASWYFIKQEQYDLTLNLAKKFINHTHDLMHKAVGWMLREVGKKNKAVLTDFLDKYASQLPRTTVRYAIERFTKEEKKKYMQKK